MTRINSVLTAAVLALAFGASGAMADTAAKPAKVAKVHSPESIECSKQADAKGLHGTERKSFRATCKAQLKAANTTAASKKPEAKAADKKS